MVNGWDQRRWYDGEESTEPSSKEELSDKSSSSALKKTPDPFISPLELEGSSS